MTFKKGDKVEYRGGTWVFERYSDISRDFCYLSYGATIVGASAEELNPKSAHDKLIDMGFVSNEPMKYHARLVEYDPTKRIGDTICNATMTIDFSLNTKGFYVYVDYDHVGDETKEPHITLELAKVLAQYLEEMGDTK